MSETDALRRVEGNRNPPGRAIVPGQPAAGAVGSCGCRRLPSCCGNPSVVGSGFQQERHKPSRVPLASLDMRVCYQLAVRRAKAPWSAPPKAEISRRPASTSNSKLVSPTCSTLRPLPRRYPPDPPHPLQAPLFGVERLTPYRSEGIKVQEGPRLHQALVGKTDVPPNFLRLKRLQTIPQLRPAKGHAGAGDIARDPVGCR